MFITLLDAGPDSAREIGGKAFNCARLLRAGFPVPPGVVVTASASDADLLFLHEHPWVIAQSDETRFAVRSSGIGEDGAGHSFAGIHDTLLNVARAGLNQAALVCRRSVASEQARAYRRTRQLADDARTGVLIQPMIAATVSGVAFTINPVTAADEVIINAVTGLGDALVSGLVEPDEFRVSKRDRALLGTHLAARQSSDRQDAVLTAVQIDELTDLLLRVERHYDAPQDIEWCYDGDRFWILQSRPITTAAALRAAGAADPSDVDIEWTRANLAEVFPDQMSPQVLAGYDRMLNGGQRRFMGRLLLPEARWGPPFKVFYGRLYFNLTQLRHVARLSGAPESGVLRSLGHSEAITSADEVRVRPALRQILPRLPDILRLARNDLTVARQMRRHEAWVETTVREFSALDVHGMTDAAIWERIDRWRSAGPEHMHLILTLGGMLFREDALRQACERVGQSYDALVYPQLAAGARSVSTEQAFALVALADVARRDPAVADYLRRDDGSFRDVRQQLSGSRFLIDFDRFLELYGHRGHYESDWSLPRYREDPTPLLFAIRSHVMDKAPADVEGTSRRLETAAAEAWRSFDRRLTTWQRWTLGRRVRGIIRELKNRYVMRERCRSNMTRLQFYVRRWHLTLADRFVQHGWIDRSDDYFMIHLDEVAAALQSPAAAVQLRSIVATRRRDLAAQATLRMPLLMHQSEVERIGRRSRDPGIDGSGALEGLCVSPGVAEAEVVVIRDPRDFRLMRAGAILVAPATDPSWTPLFTLASGVVVEVGGMLSHASTVAREYGLPPSPTSRTRPGDCAPVSGFGWMRPAGTSPGCPASELTGSRNSPRLSDRSSSDERH